MTASISNGESGSAVRAKLNEVIAKANLFESVNDSINFKPSLNYIDPNVAADSCVISGGGTNGPSTRVIEPSSVNSRNEIGANPSYVAGTAQLATIAGGYDHRNDQEAGTISGGGHNLLSYVGSHGFVGGGSHNSIIDCDYGVIVGGTANTIGASGESSRSTIGGGSLNLIKVGTNNTIAGGNSNEIEGGAGSHTIGGGFGNAITSSGAQNVIAGGTANSITGSATWAVIAGGTTNTSEATGSFIAGGRENTFTSTGIYSLAAGDKNSVTQPYCGVFGWRAMSVAEGSLNISARDFGSVVGSCQISSFQMGKQTTDATLTNLTTSGSATYPVPPENSAWCGRIYVEGRQRGTTNVAMWAWDFGFSRATGNLVIKFGGTAPAALVDDITVGAVPNIATGTGTFRIQVTGKDATDIDWAARVDLVQTRQ